jgi:hypothetical protein
VNSASRASGSVSVLIVVLSAWLGAVLFFSAMMAPAAFRILPTRALAGTLVGETLPALFLGGAVAAMLALVLLLLSGAAVVRHRIVGLLAAGAMLVSAFVGGVVLGGRIGALRARIGGTPGALPAGDPLRADFGRLHAYSVSALAVCVLCAAILLALLLSRRTTAVRHA